MLVLKQVVKKWDVWLWTGCIWPRYSWTW